MKVIYEDNHIIIVSKESGEIVQGDKTGDQPLSETVKQYLKTKYNKPGNVFVGVVHRLDRPVSGLVTFAKTSKALSRLNEMFRNGDVHKTYWALTRNCPPAESGRLVHWLRRNEQQNKSYASDREVPGSKKAVLDYKVIGRTDNYTLIEVKLLTGRHHQIRVQMAHAGYPLWGDTKYNPEIMQEKEWRQLALCAYKLSFSHPKTGKRMKFEIKPSGGNFPIV